MPDKDSVLMKCNRRGSVSAGPLLLKHGINEVSREDLEKFSETKLGAAMLRSGVVEEVSEVRMSDVMVDDAAPLESGEDESVGRGSAEDEAPAAPSLALSAAEAIDFLKTVNDEDILVACHEQETRKTVLKACEARAKQLSEEE